MDGLGRVERGEEGELKGGGGGRRGLFLCASLHLFLRLGKFVSIFLKKNMHIYNAHFWGGGVSPWRDSASLLVGVLTGTIVGGRRSPSSPPKTCAEKLLSKVLKFQPSASGLKFHLLRGASFAALRRAGANGRRGGKGADSKRNYFSRLSPVSSPPARPPFIFSFLLFSRLFRELSQIPVLIFGVRARGAFMLTHHRVFGKWQAFWK